MLDVLPKEIEEYIVDPEENCSVCGSALKIVGKKLIRTEVEFVPAKLKVKQIVQQVVKCTKCGAKPSIISYMIISSNVRLFIWMRLESK